MIRAINLSPFTSSNSRIPPPPSRVVPNDHRGGIHRALTNNNNSNDDSNQFFDSVNSSSLYSSLRQSFRANDDNINNNTNNSTTGLAARSSVPPAVDVNAAVQSLDGSTQLPSFVADIQSSLPEFNEGKKLIEQAHKEYGPNCGLTGRVCRADSRAPNANEVLFAIMLSFCVPDMERMLQMKNRHEFVNPSINTVYRLHVRRLMQCGLTEEEAEDFVLNHAVWIDSSTAEAEHDWRTHRDKKPSFIYLMETLGLRKLNATMHKSLLEHFPNLEIIVGFGEEAMEMLDLLREYFPRQIQQQRIVHHPSQVYNGMLTKAQLLRLLRHTVFRVVDVIVDGEPTVSEDEVDLDDYARTTKNSTAIEVRSLAGELLGIFEWKADVAKLLDVSASTVYRNTDGEGVFSYYGKAFLRLKKISWTNTEFGKIEDGADDLHRIIQEMAAHRTEFTSNPVEVKSLGGMTLAILKSMSNAADLLGVSNTTVYNNTDDEGKFTYYGTACCQIQRTDRRDFGMKEEGTLHQIIQEMAAHREAFYSNPVEVKSLGGMTLAILKSMSNAADLLGVSRSAIYNNTDDEGKFTFYSKACCQIQPTDREDFGETVDGADDLHRIIQEMAAHREEFHSNPVEVKSVDGKTLAILKSMSKAADLLGVCDSTVYKNTNGVGVFTYYNKAICQIQPTDRKDFGEKEDSADDLHRIIQEMDALRENPYEDAYKVCALDGTTLAIVESMSKVVDLLGNSTVYANTDDKGVFTYYGKEICIIQRTDRDDVGKKEEDEAKLRRMIEDMAASRKAFFARKGKGTEAKQKGKGTDKRKWEELNYLRVYKTNGKYIGTASSINKVSEWIHVDQEIIDQFLQTTNDGVLSIDGKTICRLERVMIGLVPGSEADLEEIREATSAIATNSFEAVSTAACADAISSEGEEILREAMSAIATKVIEGEGSDMMQKPAATATTSTKTTNLTSISILSHANICSIIPDEESAISFLTTHGVFSDPKEVVCVHCGYKGCRIKGKKQPKSLRCNRKSCSKGQSLMKGTLFEKSKVPLHQALYMARSLLSMDSYDTVLAQVGCSSATVTEFSRKFRVHIKKCLDISPNEGMGNRDPEQIERDLSVHIPKGARMNGKDRNDHLAVAVWRDIHENNLWSAFLESLKTVKYETEAVVPETNNKRKATSKAGTNATKNKRAK